MIAIFLFLIPNFSHSDNKVMQSILFCLQLLLSLICQEEKNGTTYEKKTLNIIVCVEHRHYVGEEMHEGASPCNF